MDYDELIEGLKQRGFVGTEGICNMGDCHKDEKHFVLLTDGLVIWSNIPFWRDTEYYPGSRYEIWAAEDYSDEYYKDPTPVFNWEVLDNLLKEVSKQ